MELTYLFLCFWSLIFKRCMEWFKIKLVVLLVCL